MDRAQADIDWIVREVARRLESAMATLGEANGAEGSTLTIRARVVSLAELEGRLDRVQNILVHPRAVITPAARDLLKRNNIKTITAESENGSRQAAVPLAIAVEAAVFDPEAELQGVTYETLRPETRSPLGAVAMLAEQAIGRGRLAVLITDEVAAALCAANRHRAVRAVTATTAEDVERAIDTLGANFLVVDPRSQNRFQLKRMLAALADGGWRDCPEPYRQHLG